MKVANPLCLTTASAIIQPLKLLLNFADPENGSVAVIKTIEHFGRLDALVNNAGIFGGSDACDTNSYRVYKNMMAVNTDASVKATLAAVAELKKTKGNIVFVSSVATARPIERSYAYCMSKAAMTIFAKCLAVDLAPLVRVNICSPGPVVTPIFARVGFTEKMVRQSMCATTVINRVGESEEIAAAICFLLSDEAPYMQGSDLMIDGGYVIKP